MLHRWINLNCKLENTASTSLWEKPTSWSKMLLLLCLWLHTSTNTSHTHARADHRQDCGLVGNKAVQDKQDSLHPNCNYLAVANEHCSRGKNCFAVKAQSMRAKPMCVYLTELWSPWHHRGPADHSPEPVSASGHAVGHNLHVSTSLAWLLQHQQGGDLLPLI